MAMLGEHKPLRQSSTLLMNAHQEYSACWII